MAIEKVNTWNERLMAIGVSSFDYKFDRIVNGESVRAQTDFQDLLTAIAVKRASAVEDELTPLSNIMRSRNKRLDRYGRLLATLTRMDAEFEEDDDAETPAKSTLTEDELNVLKELGYEAVDPRPKKAKIQEYLQAVKSGTDSVNNRAQSDVTRLQSLVDNRDQTYAKAAEVLKYVIDSVSKLTGTLGG